MTSAELGDRSLFPGLEARVYVNHAAVSPPSKPVQEAAQRTLQDFAARGLDAWGDAVEQRDVLRGKLARLLDAEPDDVALRAGTTTGIQDVALCYPWNYGDKVVLFEGEFPGNVTPWQQAARAFGVECVFLPLDGFVGTSGDGLARLDQELRSSRVRLVALSAVQFQSGLRMPWEEISGLCHRHGAELFVDAIQAVGAVPLSMRDGGIDYLAGGGHKWLMGLEGTGYVAMNAEKAQRLVPRVAGWLSHQDPVGFLFEGAGHLRYDRPLVESARFLEGGSMNAIGFAGLEAAVDQLLALTPRRIFDHVQELLDELESGFLDRGFRSLRHPDPDRRSCILGVLPPSGVDVGVVRDGLKERGVSCSAPDGVLRFSPHWPNALGDAGRILGALDGVSAVRGA